MIRVLIADDHRLVRDCFRALLDREPDIEVIGQARDGREAIELAERLKPDIVLMDLRMGGQSGLEAMKQIRASGRPKVIVVTMLDDEGSVRQAIGNGACGFLTKDEGFFELVAAIRAVHAGQTFFSRSIRHWVN